MRPLAVLGRLQGRGGLRARLTPVVAELARVVRAGLPPAEVGDVLTAGEMLTGLVVNEAVAKVLFERFTNMEESSVYQAILRRGQALGREEGRVEGRADQARAIILRLGQRRFGRPTKTAQAALAGIADVDRLDRIADRLDDAASWADLIATR